MGINDIVIIFKGDDQKSIKNLKQNLFMHFLTKNLGRLRYFVGIEVARSQVGIALLKGTMLLTSLESQ